MSRYNHNVVIIIPEALQTIANAIAKALDPDTGGAKTFSWVYSDGTTSFYAANTPAVDSFAQTVEAITTGALPLSALVAQAYADRWPDDVPPTEAECQAFVDGAVIRVDEPFAAVLVELGLVAVEVEL